MVPCCANLDLTSLCLKKRGMSVTTIDRRVSSVRILIASYKWNWGRDSEESDCLSSICSIDRSSLNSSSSLKLTMIMVSSPEPAKRADLKEVGKLDVR